jgi:hypothetical protein
MRECAWKLSLFENGAAISGKIAELSRRPIKEDRVLGVIPIRPAAHRERNSQVVF